MLVILKNKRIGVGDLKTFILVDVFKLEIKPYCQYCVIRHGLCNKVNFEVPNKSKIRSVGITFFLLTFFFFQRKLLIFKLQTCSFLLSLL